MQYSAEQALPLSIWEMGPATYLSNTVGLALGLEALVSTRELAPSLACGVGEEDMLSSLLILLLPVAGVRALPVPH